MDGIDPWLLRFTCSSIYCDIRLFEPHLFFKIKSSQSFLEISSWRSSFPPAMGSLAWSQGLTFKIKVIYIFFFNSFPLPLKRKLHIWETPSTAPKQPQEAHTCVLKRCTCIPKQLPLLPLSSVLFPLTNRIWFRFESDPDNPSLPFTTFFSSYYLYHTTNAGPFLGRT